VLANSTGTAKLANTNPAHISTSSRNQRPAVIHKGLLQAHQLARRKARAKIKLRARVKMLPPTPAIDAVTPNAKRGTPAELLKHLADGAERKDIFKTYA
jgi:hypothetical protein